MTTDEVRIAASSLPGILGEVLDPAAPLRDRQIARVIRCLARHAAMRPVTMTDQELEILLAVSIALRPRRRST